MVSPGWFEPVGMETLYLLDKFVCFLFGAMYSISACKAPSFCHGVVFSGRKTSNSRSYFFGGWVSPFRGGGVLFMVFIAVVVGFCATLLCSSM